jgi:hypothetical protein
MALTELESRLLEAVEKMRKDFVAREEQFAADRSKILERLKALEANLGKLSLAVRGQAGK